MITATINGKLRSNGRKTNRVGDLRSMRVKKCCGAPYGGFHKVGCEKAGLAPKRWKADETRGHRAPAPSPTIIVCVSMTKLEIAELDAAAARVQMSRSHFLRQAYKHFIAKIDATARATGR